MLSMRDVVRIPMGHLVPPEPNPLAGLVVSVQSYVIPHPDGIVLFDTGIGSRPDVERAYRLERREIVDALRRDAGIGADEIRFVVGCHLHFDHAGQNHRFPGVPIFAQRRELEAIHRPEYTLPEQVADFDGAEFEILDGEAAPLAGMRIVPTPGHTEGHQSLLLETNEGILLLAGQSFNFASDFARARGTGEHGAVWMDMIDTHDVQRVLFAHDPAAWIKPIREQ